MRSIASGIFVVVVVVLGGCARKPIKAPTEALRKVRPVPIRDDGDRVTLLESLRLDEVRLRNKGVTLRKGTETVEGARYADAVASLLAALEQDMNGDLDAMVRARFEFHEVYGDKEWGDVLVTGYYEPLLDGRLQEEGKFTQPLLRRPDDLVEVVADKFPGLKEFAPLRGRVEVDATGRKRLLPYYTREEIQRFPKKERDRLALAWVDPFEAFVMQVQGSGTVLLPDGDRVRLGYADQNGHKYEPLGKFLVDVLPPDQRTMPHIEAFWRQQPREKQEKLLNQNPSYVFFEKRDGAPMTAFKLPAIAERTIATDRRYYSKGVLAYLETEIPVEGSDPRAPVWKKVGRLVVDSDVGGAIRGPGRVDFFFGSGKDAGNRAGIMKQRGRLYYLFPKG
jgi:membrane-bound lytic murein transglycosylase A